MNNLKGFSHALFRRLMKDRSWSYGPGDTMIKINSHASNASRRGIAGIALLAYYAEDGKFKGLAKLVTDPQFQYHLEEIERTIAYEARIDRLVMNEYEPSSY